MKTRFMPTFTLTPDAEMETNRLCVRCNKVSGSRRLQDVHEQSLMYSKRTTPESERKSLFALYWRIGACAHLPGVPDVLSRCKGPWEM